MTLRNRKLEVIVAYGTGADGQGPGVAVSLADCVSDGLSETLGVVVGLGESVPVALPVCVCEGVAVVLLV